MSNIVGTLRNSFTRELLPDCLSSEVALHFNSFSADVDKSRHDGPSAEVD